MYEIKHQEELFWAVETAVAAYIFQTLASFDPDVVTEWDKYLISVGAGLARVVGAAGWNFIRSRKSRPQ